MKIVMKNNKKPSNKKAIGLTIFFIIFLVFTFILSEIAGLTHFINHQSNLTPEQSKEEKTNNSKQEYIESDSNKTDVNSSTTPVIPTSNDISISTRREADGSVTILTQLVNYSDGTCDISVTNGTKTYDQSANIIYQTSFSICAGFNIPVSSVGLGTWEITLRVTSKGTINTKTTSMDVK